MSPDDFRRRSGAHDSAGFATTQWGLILAAGQQNEPDSGEALANLCQSYWLPIYAYVCRRTSHTHEAQDVTQAFFARMLEKEWIADADRDRFRVFLLTTCKRSLINDWRKQQANRVLMKDSDGLPQCRAKRINRKHWLALA